MKSEISI